MSRTTPAAAVLAAMILALSAGLGATGAISAASDQASATGLVVGHGYDPLKGPDGTMDDDNGGPNVPDTRPTR